jgi:hypothetical protein
MKKVRDPERFFPDSRAMELAHHLLCKVSSFLARRSRDLNHASGLVSNLTFRMRRGEKKRQRAEDDKSPD